LDGIFSNHLPAAKDLSLSEKRQRGGLTKAIKALLIQ